jgi:hypothetical protein
MKRNWMEKIGEIRLASGPRKKIYKEQISKLFLHMKMVRKQLMSMLLYHPSGPDPQN